MRPRPLARSTTKRRPATALTRPSNELLTTTSPRPTDAAGYALAAGEFKAYRVERAVVVHRARSELIACGESGGQRLPRVTVRFDGAVGAHQAVRHDGDVINARIDRLSIVQSAADRPNLRDEADQQLPGCTALHVGDRPRRQSRSEFLTNGSSYFDFFGVVATWGRAT